MFRLTRHTNILEIKNKELGIAAVINLHQGARLSSLYLRNQQIISDMSNVPYQESYASTIMFPFCGRISSGLYEFEKIAYQLDCNETVNQNALHGLLYEASFNLVQQEIEHHSCSVQLEHSYQARAAGFPFDFKLVIQYSFKADTLIVDVTVENKGTKVFPFALGWHPYFYSSDLSKSQLTFESNGKIIYDQAMLATGLMDCSSPVIPHLAEALDDGYYLSAKKELLFSTPNYKLNFKFGENNPYLQLYKAPTEKHFIAIEPMSAPSNSFNSGLGLQQLRGGETYQTFWSIQVDKL